MANPSLTPPASYLQGCPCSQRRPVNWCQRFRAVWLWVGLLCADLPPNLIAQEKPVAFVGCRLITIGGQTFEHGVMVVRQGKIVALGTNDSAVPAEAEVRHLEGKTIMPGLVDTHSHIGSVSLADPSSPIQPDIRVIDSIDARDAGIKKAQAGGITTANVMPGSGLLVGGQTLYLKLRNGATIEDLLIRNASGQIAGGLKMANGTNPRRDPPFPGTRGKSAALVRERFVAAQNYRDKIARAKDDPDKMPERDLGLETLVEVLNGQRVVHHHTHRHDDIMTVLRLQKEFGFRVVLHHVSDGWKIADELAAAKASCSIILLDSPGGKLETRDVDWKTAASLEKAGVLTAFHTDDPITDSRLLLRSAGLAVRGGMSPTGALKALTINGATMLDLQDRIGSLEVGKDADFIILSGDPLSVYTHVLETWIDGVRVFDRENAKDRLFAVGGYGAGNPRTAYLCCFGNWEEQP
jgi:imidazolonepropionase-like amidohydrolase